MGRSSSFTTWDSTSIVYGLTLGLEARAPLHFMFGVLSVLFSLVNFNHAGIPGLGEHPRVSPHGRNVEIVFGPEHGQRDSPSCTSLHQNIGVR